MMNSDDYGSDFQRNLLGAKKEKLFGITDIVLLALIVVILCFSLVQRFWFSPVEISGSSMNMTIYDGDWLLMNKLAKPTYGDVVIIEISGETNYIKRVIGMEGDELYMEDGVVYRKSKGETSFTAVDEPYAYYSRGKEGRNMPLTVVGKNEIFFLGDNRWDSRDSREIGTRSIDKVLGVVPEWAIKNRKQITNYYKTVMKIDNFILSVFGMKSCGGGNK